MFLPLYDNLKAARVPVSLREYLTLLEAMQAHLSTYDIDHFYYLARCCLVKDARNLDNIYYGDVAATLHGLPARK